MLTPAKLPNDHLNDTARPEFMVAMITPKQFKLLRDTAIILVMLLPVIIWLQSNNNIFDYFGSALPPGQLAYVLSKLFALYGVTFLSLQVAVGLLIPIAGRYQIHLLLAALTLTCIGLHVGLFVYAASVRSGSFAGHLLLPNFTKGYFDIGIAFGVLSFWGVICVLFAGVCRVAGWHSLGLLHLLALPMYCSALLHSLLIGSETRYEFSLSYYLALIVVVLVVVFKRATMQKS